MKVYMSEWLWTFFSWVVRNDFWILAIMFVIVMGYFIFSIKDVYKVYEDKEEIE